ncbi:hypothetical protein [Aquimarina agarilytica]|nr:hypothetical protein [Aquimarina agarilytica]
MKLIRFRPVSRLARFIRTVGKRHYSIDGGGDANDIRLRVIK